MALMEWVMGPNCEILWGHCWEQQSRIEVIKIRIKQYNTKTTKDFLHVESSP